MTGRLGIDFGTSNTVVTVWNESVSEGESLQLSDYGRLQDAGAGRLIYIIPSLIHFTEDFRELYGNQVLNRNLHSSNRSFQWMKRYICNRSPVERSLDGRRINYYDAGRRFLVEILKSAAATIGLEDEEVALTLPVEAYEDYADWLTRVAEEAGMHRFRLLDESSAAALGHRADMEPDDIYMIFDFGGGTLDISVVRFTAESDKAGKHCRILGKAGIELGGTIIDEWLYREVLRQNECSSDEPELIDISRLILSECESMKERLSFQEHTELSVMNPETGRLLHMEMSRDSFEQVLDNNDAFALIDRTVRRALNETRERGFDDTSIQRVFMVGGCSQIPSIQKMLRRIFGQDKVVVTNPLDAVARGASAYVAGHGFKDYIQHDYTIRYVNPSSGQYEYRPLIKRGTPYPPRTAVCSITIKPAFDGQEKLGLPIFEIGSENTITKPRFEIYFDSNGAARMQHSGQSVATTNRFWINETSPTFLKADPPGVRGVGRFKVSFAIDSSRRLLVTAVDLYTTQTVLKDYPAAKLT